MKIAYNELLSSAKADKNHLTYEWENFQKNSNTGKGKNPPYCT